MKTALRSPCRWRAHGNYNSCAREPASISKVRPVALTPEQCRHYRLPRTPLKETERRATAFEARFGAGATELDALEALYPGELRRILVREIERYYDNTLNDRVDESAHEFGDRLDEMRAGVIERHQAELDNIKVEYRAIINQCNAEVREVANRFGTPIRNAAVGFNAVQQAIAEELRVAAPDIMGAVEPEEGEEDDDPLFDSVRDYYTSSRLTGSRNIKASQPGVSAQPRRLLH